MNVILFGIYSKGPEYPRQRNIIEGLESSGARVHECRYTMAGSFQERFRSATTVTGLSNFLAQLFLSYLSLSLQYLRAPRADVLLVLYPGYFHVRLARFLRLFKNRKAVILYDIFFSLYDTLVLDRGIIKESSLIASLIKRVERDAGESADLILSDTFSHASYLSELLRFPREKFKRVLVGPTFVPFSEPAADTGGGFSVLYVGTYIPLHGVETILGAAEELKNEPGIHFRLVGTGQLRSQMEDLAREKGLTRVSFRDWVPADELGLTIRACDLSLGVFGVTEKTRRVIPIKVFDICAAGVPMITADTPAIREVFTHGENAWLVPPGDGHALAEAIMRLEEDRELRERLARAAQKLARTLFSVDEIGRELAKVIEAHGRMGEGATQKPGQTMRRG